MVSVVMITYNHEAYLAQAINGVLMQECDFEVELIIADDCSPDQTQEVVKSFRNHKNFKWIKYTRHPENKGVINNFIWAINQCKSKYIALCEGDDYWIDIKKIQKHVDFLELNSDFILCHSNVKTQKKDGEISEFHTFKKWNILSDVTDYKTAIFNPTAFTCSVLFRNTINTDLFCTKIVSGDWMLFVLLTLNGKCKYFNENQAVYRLDIGISVNAKWSDYFFQQSLFLLSLVSLSRRLNLNLWLIRGAFYFILMKLQSNTNLNVFSLFARRIRFKYD